MDALRTLLAALHADPTDDTARLAVADALEESGRDAEAELLRLHLSLRNRTIPPTDPAFLRLNHQLLVDRVRPVVPEVANSVGMRFALVPPGRFLMGSPDDERERFNDEGPVHEVEISRGFYLGVFPVTRGEWYAVGYADQPQDIEERLPIDNIDWNAAMDYCERLSQRPEEIAAGRRYRLPSEAEWEYACRAGISGTGPFHFGQAITAREANFRGEHPYGSPEEVFSHGRLMPVDAYPPNAFGIYDLHGNVSEWCLDAFDPNYYRTGPSRDPVNLKEPAEDVLRVLRGGAWDDRGEFCRAAFRYDRPPSEDRDGFGLRLVMERTGTPR